MEKEDRIVSIDLWRGMAALAVLAIHIPHHSYGGWRENPLLVFDFLADYGYIGVPIFVVISGFCIHRRQSLRIAVGDEKRNEWGRFWIRRFIRLYPTYVAAIAFSLLLAAFHTNYNWDRTLVDSGLHLAMVHNLTTDYATGLGNGAFWSLGMEEQLYLLYIPLLWMFLRLGPASSTALAFAITLGWRIGWAMDLFPESGVLGRWMMWPFAFWFHWALGAYAVHCWARDCRIPGLMKSLTSACIFFAAGIILNSNFLDLISNTRVATSGVVVWGLENERLIQAVGELSFPIGFFCLLNWGLERERTGGFRSFFARHVSHVGLLSYSLYLIHAPIIQVLETCFEFGQSPIDWIARYAIYSSICLAAAVGFFHLAERPFLRMNARSQKVST